MMDARRTWREVAESGRSGFGRENAVSDIRFGSPRFAEDHGKGEMRVTCPIIYEAHHVPCPVSTILLSKIVQG
jgi:hypothetical protein